MAVPAKLNMFHVNSTKDWLAIANAAYNLGTLDDKGETNAVPTTRYFDYDLPAVGAPSADVKVTHRFYEFSITDEFSGDRVTVWATITEEFASGTLEEIFEYED